MLVSRGPSRPFLCVVASRWRQVNLVKWPGWHSTSRSKLASLKEFMNYYCKLSLLSQEPICWQLTLMFWNDLHFGDLGLSVGEFALIVVWEDSVSQSLAVCLACLCPGMQALYAQAWNFKGETRYTVPPRSSGPLSPLSGHNHANTKVDPDAVYGSDTTQGAFGDYQCQPNKITEMRYFTVRYTNHFYKPKVIFKPLTNSQKV